MFLVWTFFLKPFHVPSGKSQCIFDLNALSSHLLKAITHHILFNAWQLKAEEKAEKPSKVKTATFTMWDRWKIRSKMSLFFVQRNYFLTATRCCLRQLLNIWDNSSDLPRKMPRGFHYNNKKDKSVIMLYESQGPSIITCRLWPSSLNSTWAPNSATWKPACLWANCSKKLLFKVTTNQEQSYPKYAELPQQINFYSKYGTF